MPATTTASFENRLTPSLTSILPTSRWWMVPQWIGCYDSWTSHRHRSSLRTVVSARDPSRVASPTTTNLGPPLLTPNGPISSPDDCLLKRDLRRGRRDKASDQPEPQLSEAERVLAAMIAGIIRSADLKIFR